MKKNPSSEEKKAWAAYMREYHHKTKHLQHRKKADLKKKYGITLDQYNEMWTLQGGVCKLCNKPETQMDVRFGVPYQLAVDHDHKTGKIRSLLCSKCNRILGMANDDVIYLAKCIEYLSGV